MLTTSMATLAVVAAGLGAEPDSVTPQQQDVEALQQRVAQLEGQIENLTGQSRMDWRSQDIEELRGLVSDVMNDASTRANWQGGSNAGWDKGFFLASSDGNFKLKISGQMQFRFVNSFLDDDPMRDNDRRGFEMRRAKLGFKGHIVDPSWRYNIKGAFDRGGGAFALEDAEIIKEYDNGWSVRVGQFKGPFMREELISSSRQQAVERSLVNEEFNQDRSQGVEADYETDTFRMALLYSDGFGTDNTPALDYDTEFAFTARAEFLFGEGASFSDFKDFQSWMDGDQAFLVGAAAHYEKEEYGTAAGPEEETFTYTVDVSAKFGGFNVFGAFVGRTFDVAPNDQYGFVLQGGMFLAEDFDVFLRYEYGDLDEDGGNDLNVVTGGFNKYFSKHAMKWTTDIGYAFDPIDSDWATSGAGWRETSEDGQFVLRSQLQILF